MQQGVSFFTCCYEADWEFLLVQGRLKQLVQSFQYPFAKRCLIINNVDDKEKVRQHALQAQQEKVIDDFYFSDALVDRVFERFNLARKSFKLDGFDGYWFSIAPLTSFVQQATSCISPQIAYLKKTIQRTG